MRVSVHYRGACHIVRGVEVSVPVRGEARASQPRFVVAGRVAPENFRVREDGVAEIGPGEAS